MTIKKFPGDVLVVYLSLILLKIARYFAIAADQELNIIIKALIN